jgi:hypothetical protein
MVGRSTSRYTCARGTVAREDPSRPVWLGLFFVRSFPGQTVTLVLDDRISVSNEPQASEILQRVPQKRKRNRVTRLHSGRRCSKGGMIIITEKINALSYTSNVGPASRRASSPLSDS